jgi:hypothetical protein
MVELLLQQFVAGGSEHRTSNTELVIPGRVDL